MASALTPPYVVAALVVLIAGLAKLRSPDAAADGLLRLGGRRLRPGARHRAVRGLALAEVALAAVALAGFAAAPYALAALYLAFAAVAFALIRVRAQCGCFGEAGTPVSGVHVTLDLVFAAVCLLAAVSGAHGVGDVLRLPAWQAPPALLGVTAAGGAAVLAFTELPRAWQAWAGDGG